MRFSVPLRRAAVSAAALSAALAAYPANAIEVDPNDDAVDLSGTLFANVEGVSNVVAFLSGAPDQFGTFTNERAIYGLPQEGIILSTGNVADYGRGPNLSGGNTSSFDGEEGGGEGGFGSATEQQISLLTDVTGEGFQYFDVAQLSISFDVEEGVDTITFFGVFGSEEFPNAGSSPFIDGFGLFVNGENVAFAGEGQQTLTGNHPDFLGARPVDDLIPIDPDNPDFEGPDGPFFPPVALAFNEVPNDEVDEPIGPPPGGEDNFNESLEIGDPRLALVTGTELDGVIAPGANPVLRFDVPVRAGANTIDIIIADTGDSILDSTVYLSSLLPQEFDINGGATEFAPILPDSEDDGVFVFILPDDIDLGEIFFIDPPVAVGYTYTVTDAEFALIQAPTQLAVPDPNGYQIDFIDGMGVAQSFDLDPGEVLDISAFNVTEFVLSGIDVSLFLDPNDPLAFPLGVALQNIDPNATSGPQITQAALTEDVQVIPLPGGLPLYLGALGAFFAIRRLRKTA